MKWWTWLRRHKAGNVIIVFVVVQLLCVAFGLMSNAGMLTRGGQPAFEYLSIESLLTLQSITAPLAIMALGVGVLMIAGEFDLSVGSTYALSAYIMALMYSGLTVGGSRVFLPAPAAMLLCLLVGAGIGAINGVITLRAKIPSFIATLGAMMFWRGILLALSKGSSLSFRPGQPWEALFTGSIWYVKVQFLWALLVMAAVYLLMERHRLGNHIFSVGGNVNSALAIGVKPVRVKMFCFVLVGVLAAFAGMIDAIDVPTVSPKQGSGMELQAIAACVVGGLSLSGGIGSVIGVLLGTTLLYTIRSVLFLLSAPGEYLQAFVGLLIVVAVIFNRVTRKE
jgi:simple sugar transport system permease protein